MLTLTPNPNGLRPPDPWDEEGIRDPTPRLPAVQNGELVAPHPPDYRLRRSIASADFWQNFGKMLLVFGCIGTDFCK